MNPFGPSLKKAFKAMESTLVKNIAHALFDIEFHIHATDEELMLYYGAGVDRDALITDTRRKLDGDQRLLRFYQDHKELFNAYGTKEPTDDFIGAEGRDAMEADRSAGDAPGSVQGGSEGPDQGSEGGDGHQDYGPATGTHRGDGAEEHRSGGELDHAAGSDRRDDSGGEGAVGEEAASRSGETITLTLPTESEARRLELDRITRDVGTIEKTDGDEVTVRTRS
jgi:hypothetical protein